MLRISHISIDHFRSYSHLEMDLDSYAILLGRNNSGKSNLLLAIKLLLEGTPREVSLEDFRIVNLTIAPEICIEATVTGVDADILSLCDESHRAKITPRVVDETIRIRRVITREGDKITVAKLTLYDPKTGTFDLPTGIEAALKQFLPEVIFIEAFKDPSDETQYKSSNTLGKILKQVVAPVSAQISSEVTDAIKLANEHLNVLEDETGALTDQRPADLIRVEQEIRGRVQQLFGGADVRLEFGLPGVPELLATATVRVKDVGPWTQPQGKGQGFQRALYVALLQVLADELRKDAGDIKRPFVLLCEEPEAFLHPALQRAMGNALEGIAGTNQVIIATHSPVLVTPRLLDHIAVLRQRPDGPAYATTCFRPSILASAREDDKQLVALLKLNHSAEFLFSDHVLVVEGPSDKTLIESCWHVLETRKGGEPVVLAVVEAGSKHAVPAWCGYLRRMGYKACGLVDLDYIWNGAGACLGADPLLSQVMEDFWRAAAAASLLDPDDRQRKICAGKKPEAFRLLIGAPTPDERLVQVREQIKTQAGVWVLSQGEIESYFGLSASSKGHYVEAAQRVRKTELAVPDEIEALVDWWRQA